MYSGPALGLWSSPNPFAATPAGTLKRADNVRFTAPSILAPRRGMAVWSGTTFGSAASLADSLAFYGTSALMAYDLTKVSLYSGSSFSDFSGTYVPVGDNRMRFEGAARSAYFNTSTGLQVWDGTGVSGQPIAAGNKLGLTATVKADSANGWMDSNTSVAYRYTICSKDAFGRVVEGPPSGRTVLRNSLSVPVGEMTRAANVVTVTYNSGVMPYVLHVGDVITVSPGEANFPAGAFTLLSVNNSNSSFTYSQAGANASSSVVMTLTIAVSGALRIPLLTGSIPTVTTNNFLRVYRSDMTLAATDTPSDELYQCYETGFITSANLSAGYIDALDTAPESVIDVPLYTNTNSGVGELQANFQPPRSLDIVYWANRMWFANTENKDALQFSMLGVGSPDGVQVGDTFIIDYNNGGLQLTFTAATAASGFNFQVFVDGDPGWNVERTARSLVTQINAVAQDNFSAFYVSSEGGLPGDILIQATSFDSPFKLYSSRPESWTPQLPTLVSPAWPAPASDTNRHPAGLFYSRLGLPEAVPLVNYSTINSDADEILRIFPLHYRLLIFKTDGIYTCTNVEPFSIQKLSAYRLIAPDSVDVLEDRVYALTDQGLITISDSGVVEVSTPINDILYALGGPTSLDSLSTRAFGMAYRSEKQYLLWVISQNDDGTFTDDNTQAFVYSTLSGGFTRYAFGARCGAFNPATNQMVVAPIDDNALWIENKTLTQDDYSDLLLVRTITHVSGSDVTLSDVSDVEVGDALAQFSVNLVESISGNVVTVKGTPLPGWINGAVYLVKAIPCAVEFNKLTGGAPAEMKLVDQTSFLFRANGIHDTVAAFHSEIQLPDEEVELSQDGWGEFGWGEQPYGSPCEQIRRVEPMPKETANCCQLSVGFSTYQARASFEFLGIDVAEHDDTRANRG